MVFQVERVQEPSQVEEPHEFNVEGKIVFQEADWFKVKLKRKQLSSKQQNKLSVIADKVEMQVNLGSSRF